MFEQESINYLNQLISDNVIISGDIIGVSEIQNVAQAKATFLINDILEEKFIVLRKHNNVFSWYFLNPIDNNLLNISPDDWTYPNYLKRIIAPTSMIMDDIGIKMFGWFQINSLPFVTKDNNIYLYCNYILPEHQYIIDSLGGIITIEDKPAI